MSHHLATLERAGLVQSERESRLIHYRADYAGMRRLLTFLMQDCCQGAPEMCSDLIGRLHCETAS
jgi:DNA-binding transcriptional ArsR family regulator